MTRSLHITNKLNHINTTIALMHLPVDKSCYTPDLPLVPSPPLLRASAEGRGHEAHANGEPDWYDDSAHWRTPFNGTRGNSAGWGTVPTQMHAHTSHFMCQGHIVLFLWQNHSYFVKNCAHPVFEGLSAQHNFKKSIYFSILCRQTGFQSSLYQVIYISVWLLN